MNENNILISIVVPCYNEASCIGANLLKAKKISSLHPIEFIFVDNGSTDGTAKILNKGIISKLSKKIQFINIRENKSDLCQTLTANMGTGGNNVPFIKV